MYVKVWERKRRAGPPGPPPTIKLKFGTKGIPSANSIVFRNLFNGSARVVGYNTAQGIYYVELITQGFRGITDWTSLLSEARFLGSVLINVQEIYADVPDKYAITLSSMFGLGLWKGVELLSHLFKRR